MDPLTMGAAAVAGVSAGNTAMRGAKNVAAGFKGAIRKLRLSGMYDPEWLDLGLRGNSLTASQSQDVDKFLTSPRVQPVLRFVALGKLIPTSAAHPEIMSTMESAFRSEAERWLLDSSENWKGNVEEVWNRLLQIYDELVPSVDHEPDLVESAENYVDFLSSPLGKPVNKSGLATAYLNRLTELGSDLESLIAAATTSRHLAQLIQSAGHTPIINHIDVSKRIAFRDLYVGRHFRDPKSNVSLESEDLVSRASPFRVVLKGAPGAGKSTFVSHFVHAMATAREGATGIPSVVVRCREYVRNAWGTSITDYAAQKTAADLSTTLPSLMLEAMLLTGQVAVVFDGLDEITDRSQRAEMVQRIHAFTAQYPPTSVLITTRTVGYERAPLDSIIFRSLELQEFSLEQVREYATRWFTHAGRTDLCEPFISESKSVHDLRVNPLLLSLLCNLYRNSGEIPSNRREIYADCAELLFKRWDAHRQIQVSHSVPRFANQLMQQIAEWFFNTTSAQSGVEERQIAKVIAEYMISDIGLLPDEAREAAKEFLDFCADRAWLLGSEGTNDRNQRLYAFTHRTFLEFFAAEAMAREAASAPVLASHIREAFDRDSTSLVPELLIQSYDVVRRRGGTHVFEELCRSETSPTLLLLRLLDGAVVAKYALNAGLKLLIERWEKSRQGIPREEFLALLAINPIARGNFVETFLMTPEEETIRQLFLSGWSSHQLSGGGRYEDSWRPASLDIATTYSRELASSTDENILNWLLVEGLGAAIQPDPWNYVCSEGTFGSYGGAVWWCIENAHTAAFTEAQIAAITKVHALTQKTPIPGWALYVCGDVEPSPALKLGSKLSPIHLQLRDILAFVLLAAYEQDQRDGDLHAASQCWPGRIDYAARYRDWRHGHGAEPAADEIQDALRTIAELPPRIKKWTNGGTYLVADSRLRF
ncbi:NACHT domain-containing protein [Arthrobacter sp. MDT3-24]